ncbi:MAG: DsbE family thiol:disulfide interchange protein [Geminicoccaceae bacterium]
MTGTGMAGSVDENGASSDAADSPTTDSQARAAMADPGKSTVKAAPSWRRLGYMLPVMIFLIICIGFAVGLTRDPGTLPSALIDKPVPTFELPPLLAAGDTIKGLSSDDLTGKVQLVNVFASWCGPCRVEHPILMKMAGDGVPIQGLNYKDKAGDAAGFLAELGDPYERIGVDANGRVGIDWGVYGVPETFIIDAEGKIRYRHVGPIQRQADVDKLMAIIEDVRQ